MYLPNDHPLKQELAMAEQTYRAVLDARIYARAHHNDTQLDLLMSASKDIERELASIHRAITKEENE